MYMNYAQMLQTLYSKLAYFNQSASLSREKILNVGLDIFDLELFCTYRYNHLMLEFECFSTALEFSISWTHECIKIDIAVIIHSTVIRSIFKFRWEKLYFTKIF